MGWSEPTPDAVAMFTAAVPEDPRVQLRWVWGCPCLHVGGHLVAGLSGDEVFVRLSAGVRADLRDRGWQAFEPIPGHPLTALVVLPSDQAADPVALGTWLGRAIEEGLALPPTDQRAW